MSGLETAIRNALDRSERGDGQVRARIYQSARQALDAGLRKQGVTDNLVILQQRKKLEEKIREIEDEEIDRLAAVAQPPLQASQPSFSVDPVAQPIPRSEPVMAVDTPVARQADPQAVSAPQVGVAIDPPVAQKSRENVTAMEAPVVEAGALGGVTRSAAVSEPMSEPMSAPMPGPIAEAAAADAADRKRKGRGKKQPAATERAAKPRRRRGFLSHLVTWLVTLGVVAVGCFVFYQSGMVQSILDEAMQAASRPAAFNQQGQGPSALSSRGGFSSEWADIFEPEDGANFRAGAQAQAQIATGSEGQALRLASGNPGANGDVAIEVPVEILRELAGKSSTLAVTIQSAVNQPVQLAVRCEFGSLGTCSRHRFTATQEKQDALLRVSFDRTMAPNAPGRLILNSGIGGTGAPVFIYSIRALPGQ